eukprot:1196254-Prorocentrum_minimum.AAC.9
MLKAKNRTITTPDITFRVHTLFVYFIVPLERTLIRIHEVLGTMGFAPALFYWVGFCAFALVFADARGLQLAAQPQRRLLGSRATDNADADAGPDSHSPRRTSIACAAHVVFAVGRMLP